MTDQAPDATAPTPFTLFPMSLGECTGYYVQAGPSAGTGRADLDPR